MDQVLVSGCNFLISIILARFLSASEFGLYIFAFTALVFAVGFTNNAVFSAVSVIGASVEDEKWIKVYRSAIILFLIASLGLISLFLCLAYTLNRINYELNGYILKVTAATLFFYLSQEFFRRILFTRLKGFRALVIDGVTYLPRVGLIYLACMLNRNSATAHYAVYVIGITSALGALVGFLWSNGLYVIRRFEIDRPSMRRLVHNSKWMIAEWFPFVVAGSLYVYVVAFMLGNEYNGILGACRNLVQPITILLLSITNIALPFYSRLFSGKGPSETVRHILKFFGLLSMAVLCYLLVVNIFADSILTLLFGKYANHGPEVFLFSLANLFIFLLKPVETYLKASLRPKMLFKARAISAGISVVSVVPMISLLGLSGALYSYVLTEAIMCMSAYYFLFTTEESAFLSMLWGRKAHFAKKK